MNVLDFQKEFLEAINQESHSQEVENDIIPIGNLSVGETLNIYRNDYYARLTEALGELFETIWMILGDDDFKTICHEYISSHPSSVQNLASYGDGFAKFLKSHEISKDFPFLSDVSIFESNYWSVFHSEAPSTKPIWPTEGVLSPNLRIELDSSTILFSSAYCCLDLFYHRGQSAETFKGEIFRPQFALLYKELDTVKVLELTRVQFELLDSLEEQSLEEAICSLELIIVAGQETLNEVQDLFIKLRNSNVPLQVK